MLAALSQLGVQIELDGTDKAQIQGACPFPTQSGESFLGNAGTAFRPLTAAFAVMGGDYQLSGVPRMHERPIGDLVDALLVLGADIRSLGNPTYPPLAIGRGEIGRAHV